MNPFTSYKVYGPTYNKKIDRNMIFLVSPEHRTSMTYARYLMCMHKERWLDPDEHVDHIDDNRLNDVIENLQILSKAENTRKSARPRTMVTLVCPSCKDEFTRERRQTHLVKGGSHSCCSRTCARKSRGYTSVG